jgi:hypothetical protein
MCTRHDIPRKTWAYAWTNLLGVLNLLYMVSVWATRTPAILTCIQGAAHRGWRQGFVYFPGGYLRLLKSKIVSEDMHDQALHKIHALLSSHCIILMHTQPSTWLEVLEFMLVGVVPLQWELSSLADPV